MILIVLFSCLFVHISMHPYILKDIIIILLSYSSLFIVFIQIIIDTNIQKSQFRPSLPNPNPNPNHHNNQHRYHNRNNPANPHFPLTFLHQIRTARSPSNKSSSFRHYASSNDSLMSFLFIYY